MLAADDLRRVAHLLQLLNDRFGSSGAHQQHAVGETPDEILRQFLARQQFLGKHGVF